MWLIKKITDLILYGNFWIALGALALTWQTQLIFGEEVEWNDLAGFVFCSTWLLYALHRIVGILRLKDFLEIERYRVISRFRNHIIIYAIIAGVGTIWYFFQLPFKVQVVAVLPGFFSLAYVLPFFGKQRRLRDFDQIKIYLVALVWAWVTVILPATFGGYDIGWSVVFMFVERSLFVFAITLPFDIRDLQVDGHSKVSTIPGSIGVRRSIQLALVLLAIGFLMIGMNYYLGFYGDFIFYGLVVSYVSTAYFLSLSNTERHDYFYSALMDGTMILQGVLAYVFMSFIP